MNKSQIITAIYEIDPTVTVDHSMLKDDLESTLIGLQNQAPFTADDGETHRMFSLDDLSGASGHSWSQLEDEKHKPGDILENYHPNFQSLVQRLRAITELAELKGMGSKAYTKKGVWSPEMFNFFWVEYKMKKNSLIPPITQNGMTFLEGFDKDLGTIHDKDYFKVNVSQQLYKIDLEATYGLNVTEIDKLWIIHHKHRDRLNPINYDKDFDF